MCVCVCVRACASVSVGEWLSARAGGQKCTVCDLRPRQGFVSAAAKGLLPIGSCASAVLAARGGDWAQCLPDQYRPRQLRARG